MPRPNGDDLGKPTLTSSDFRSFCAHGSRMSIDDQSAPTETGCLCFCSGDHPRLPPRARANFPSHRRHLRFVFSYNLRVSQPALPPMTPSQGADSAGVVNPAVSAPLPPSPLAPPSPSDTGTLPSSGRLSTRTCRRTAAPLGAEQSVVDYGFGLGGVSHSSVRRASTPPCTLRLRSSSAGMWTHLSYRRLSRRHPFCLAKTEPSL